MKPTLDKVKGTKACQTIIRNEGSCYGVSCEECPGSQGTPSSCTRNGWRSNVNPHAPCKVTVRNARKWLKDNQTTLLGDWLEIKLNAMQSIRGDILFGDANEGGDMHKFFEDLNDGVLENDYCAAMSLLESALSSLRSCQLRIKGIERSHE